MKSPEEWSRCFNWNGQTEGQILYQIEAIQRDALLEAAEIADKLCHSPECKDEWSITRTGVFISFRDAILERSREI